MEKRLLLAVVLMTAAILITNILFPPPEPPAAVERADSVAVAAAPEPSAPVLPVATATGQAEAGDTIVVESELYRLEFASVGGTLVGAELLEYPSYSSEGQMVQLVPDGSPGLFRHRLVMGADTVDLSALPFAASSERVEVGTGGTILDLTYRDEGGFGIALRYQFEPDSYLYRVSGRVEGVPPGEAALLLGVGPGLGIHEHPDHHSEREFAVVTGARGGVERIPFRRVEGVRPLGDTLTWAGIKDKYFLVSMVAGEEHPFSSAVASDAPDALRPVGEDTIPLPQANVVAALPLAPDGTFSYAAYVGPQDYGRLAAIGYDLQEVTPYGYRWLQPVIRPLAAAVLWVLNTLHDTLGIAYGWVLVLFGVMMRVVLWPLNAKAMRAQMKNMAVQPLLQEIKEKYKNDPQKQQEALLALYKEHGFNPLAGCLPMLIPFPVLITLFFVFQNTIAFRGAEFLWLPDLSLRDPLYLLPLVLVVSMFGLQWVSAHLSGVEQNPQMKMMMYMMPLMMGFLFFMLPSGLNLYYAVTQVASIPQQVLIAKERRQAQEELKRGGGAKPPASGGARRKAPRARR